MHRPPGTGDASDEDDETAEVELVPPEGSHAWKLAALKRERPGLYASRHVAIAVLQTLIGLLGIGALVFGIVRGVLPNIDLPAIPFPNIDNPLPDWLRYLLSWQWLVDLVRASPLDFLFDLSWPDSTGDVLRWARWVVPILIAIAVAVEEYVRRTRRSPDNGEESSDHDTDTEDIRVTNTIANEPAPAAPTVSGPSAQEQGNTDQGPDERPKAEEAPRPVPPQE